MVCFRKKLLVSYLLLFVIFGAILFFVGGGYGLPFILMGLFAIVAWLIAWYLSHPIQRIVSEKTAVLDSLIEGVVAVDSNMMITYVNRMALKMLKKERQDLLGRKFPNDLPPECHALLINSRHKNQAMTSTCILEGPPKVYFDVVAAPRENGGGTILVFEDKSAYYQILEMRKDFIANASHELKTPITIVRGFAEALHDHPDLPRATAIAITEKIVRNCQRMETLVKNLLTLADIENLPSSRLQECNLLEIVENCRELVLSVYPKATIDVEEKIESGVHLVGDPDLLELAIVNLLDNAAKYSSKPAEIKVTIDLVGDQAKLTVSDKGIGIPKEDLEHIFLRFYTVDKAHSRQLGGSGLGLSIVQTIISKHDGKIFVESKLGEGTTFTILLPLNLSQ